MTEYIQEKIERFPYGEEFGYAEWNKQFSNDTQPWNRQIDDYYLPKKKKRNKAGKVTIMRGLPGSGKSTTVEAIAEWPHVIASADDFFMVDDEYVFDVRKIVDAHQHCWGVFIDALFAGVAHILVDNTNMRAVEYGSYVKLAKNMGYNVEIICVKAGLLDDTPLSTLFERGKHGVPMVTLERMKQNFQPDVGERYV